MSEVIGSHGGSTRFPVLKVLGLGGGGCNAINRMIELGISGVDFLAAKKGGNHPHAGLPQQTRHTFSRVQKIRPSFIQHGVFDISRYDDHQFIHKLHYTRGDRRDATRV